MKRCPNPDCPDRDLPDSACEYRDDVELCPKCSEPLVFGAAEAAAEVAPRHLRYELAGAVGNSALLPLAKSLLEDAGIAYVTRNEITQNLIGWGQLGTGFNPVIGAVELWVDSDRVDEAAQLLADLENAEVTGFDDEPLRPEE